MKFFRNYIILILFLAIILLVLQKTKVIPSFTEFLSSAENKEEKLDYIISSIKQMEEPTSIYYVHEKTLDTSISGIRFKGNFISWIQFHAQIKNNFSAEMITMNGKKIHISLPIPELSYNDIKITHDKNFQGGSRITFDELHKIGLMLSYQEALTNNVISICKQNTQKIISQFLSTLGFTDIKIDFIQN